MNKSLRVEWPILLCRSYPGRMRSLFGGNLVGYWPLLESSGAAAHDTSGNNRDGSYTGVDLFNTAAPFGRKAPYFDGANALVNVYSASYAGAVNPAEGTAMIWCKVSDAADWTDGAFHTCQYIAADTNNRVILRKGNGNGLYLAYIAGATTKSVDVLEATTGNTTDWFHLAFTWSKAADEVKGYFNGAQIGATKTALGNWVGSLSTTLQAVGSANGAVPTLPWKGWLCHAIVLNRPATATEVLRASRGG